MASATLCGDAVTYCEIVEDIGMWPVAGLELLEQFQRASVLGLIVGTRQDTDRVVARMRDDLNVQAVSLGFSLSDRRTPPTTADLEQALGEAVILSDLDLLFEPSLHMNVVKFLAQRALRIPTVAVWPGEIIGRRASYGARGRADHQESGLSSATIIRPRSTRFPDEMPFQIERIHR